ncbi:AAA family ATPase [Candidatus Chloroploca asiatica]|uniref:Magnesium chelatase n=1 Tax=Candidatus Chloroploca asiatica TaxID=1506545 RepID=A0A2H3KXA1_9CHLR|nr:MoxR family ATPase [Candidatus Chloroploca asiatica]PDW00063.1 magnesium chelatase [Candidatus Chloroploca asiatica]
MKTQSVVEAVRAEARKVLVGQEEPFTLLIVALLAGGHVLIEGVPGTAKTLMAKTLALLVRAEYKRVQFTPDLMPSDVIGTQIFEPSTGQFRLRRGPVFTQVLLGDEINRAPAKTQSALLEAMEERQVTIEGERLALPDPFFVIATQNPIEYEGTYPLPEAQLDRFLFKLVIDYPPGEQELEILRRYHRGFDARRLEAAHLQPVIAPADLASCREEIGAITVEDGIISYIGAITLESRRSPDLIMGGSTRASIALLLTAKAYAAAQGRNYVTPDDIKALVRPVYRHRIILRPEAEIEGMSPDTALGRILARVEVPR